MGLFSKSGKNKQDSAGAGQDSGYYTSADDQAVLERARSKRASSADGPKRGRTGKEAADDPMLPEKKRARRRLVGAIALALTVAIVLPMVLDSEPKPLASDIDIKIPAKDKAAEAAAPAAPAAAASAPAAPAPQAASPAPAPAVAPTVAPAVAPATVPAAAALDKSEEIITDPVKPAKPGKSEAELKLAKAEAEAKAEAKAKLEAEARAEAKAKADAKAEADKLAKAKQEAEAKARQEAKAKADSEHKEAKAEPKPNDDARALAILEGKPAEANQKYVLQVAALATQDKVDELQEKLKEAGIKSFTQKVPTAQGERTRIRVGPFNSKEEAEKVRAKLTKLGLNGSLVPV